MLEIGWFITLSPIRNEARQITLIIDKMVGINNKFFFTASINFTSWGITPHIAYNIHDYPAKLLINCIQRQNTQIYPFTDLNCNIYRVFMLIFVHLKLTEI